MGGGSVDWGKKLGTGSQGWEKGWVQRRGDNLLRGLLAEYKAGGRWTSSRKGMREKRVKGSDLSNTIPTSLDKMRDSGFVWWQGRSRCLFLYCKKDGVHQRSRLKTSYFLNPQKLRVWQSPGFSRFMMNCFSANPNPHARHVRTLIKHLATIPFLLVLKMCGKKCDDYGQTYSHYGSLFFFSEKLLWDRITTLR